MATNVRLHGSRYRSFCEGCGDVPASAYALHTRHILTTGEWITVCDPCWGDVLHGRPRGAALDALLEELWEHRYRAPQRRAMAEMHARAFTAPH